MALSAAEVASRVNRYVARVRRHVPVEAVYLFGSYAAGHPDDASDIDLAVISSAFGTARHADLSLLSRCRLPDALEIEALPFSDSELRELPPGSFLREIVRTGVAVREEPASAQS